MGVVTMNTETLLHQRELELEAEAIAEFIAVLEQEQSALKEYRIDAVNDLATGKASRLAALTRHAERRNQRLKSAGCSQDSAGMSTWLSSCASLPGVAAAWTRITGLARVAQEKNETNGWLVSIQMQRNARQLAFLHKLASNEPTYSADGVEHASARQRSLGEA